MKKLLILSGKGGTGKTTTAAAFMVFSHAGAAADCDVDAPNLHLVTKMKTKPEKNIFFGGEKAQIDAGQCISCGLCAEKCRFGAIKQKNGRYTVQEYACEGCGVCAYVCPQKAISLSADAAGDMELYRDKMVFSTAKLKMGRGNSGKLVTAVKNQVVHAAHADVAIVDGSPGIGCPVIASITGMDLVLIVAEPSASGISDLKRIVKTASILNTPVIISVNKYDVSLENTKLIQDFCKQENIPFAGCVPYDKTASCAINKGQSIADFDCPARTALYQVYQNTMKLLNTDMYSELALQERRTTL